VPEPDAGVVPEAFVAPGDVDPETVPAALDLLALVVDCAEGAATIGICPNSGEDPGR
jgi:hypothetical protein